MFNLLRMDLYRMKRSKSVYVCLGLLLVISVFVYAMIWLLAVPQGQETAIRIGMLTAEEAHQSQSILDGADTLVMYRQISLDGGMYNVIFGICVMLFICMDHQSGFLKNIMAVHQNRWAYVGSKLIAAAILDIFYLSSGYLFVLLLNGLFEDMLPRAEVGDVLFYMAWAWLVTLAFAGLILLVCVCARSVAAGAVAAVLLGGGAIVAPLYQILTMFHIGDWLKYSLYLTLAMGPSRYASPEDMKVFAVGAGFLVLYPMLAGIVLKKQDI